MPEIKRDLSRLPLAALLSNGDRIKEGMTKSTAYAAIQAKVTAFAVNHAKPEFAHWPIGRETYGGTDYRGVDLSWWKNHPSPVSFFCFHSDEDFFGGYDHGRQAGVLHVADHFEVPGKKFFEWGNGPEGGMWSKVLTDDDGPYLELMAGAWSDNQPDYSWLEPGQTREWKHWWYPIRQMDGVKNANRDAAVNLEVRNRVAKIAVNATKEFPGAQVRLELVKAGGAHSAATALLDRTAELSPAKPFAATVTLTNDVSPESLRLTVLDASGRELIAYQPVPRPDLPMPKPVERPRPPRDYASTDELYFTGQRIEQLFSPSFEAAPYYQEMLRRDPGDYRANTALGIDRCRQWRWAEAAKYLSNAIARATENYIRPKDTEAFYYLGAVLKAQDKLTDAYEAFQKAVWSPAWQAPGGCELAEIDLRRGQAELALKHVELALTAGTHNPWARNLKAAVLRKLGRPEAAEQVASDTLAIDPLNVRAAAEQVLAQRQQGNPEWMENVGRLRQLMRGNPEAFEELAIEFANAGQWTEVAEMLSDQAQSAASGESLMIPTERYLLACSLCHVGRTNEVAATFALAASASPAFCFPSRFEEEDILRRAESRNTNDANAPYLLGCLLYDRQPDNAIKAWEEARQRDGTFALTHRNLGLAYAQYEKNPPKAIASLERAVELDPNGPRFFYELDGQYEAAGAPVAQRLTMLTRHHDVVARRDDALIREIELLTVAGVNDPPKLDRAIELLTTHRFHNWEGSSGIHEVYANALLTRGQARLRAQRFAGAMKDFAAALEYPANLEVGRPRHDAHAAEVFYLTGLAQAALDDAAAAKEAFTKAIAQPAGGATKAAYFHAQALKKLGRDDEARPVFERLAKAGEQQLQSAAQPDYFAKFGQRQSGPARQAQAHYLAGLGHLGLGQTDLAKDEFARALALDPAHLGANEQLVALVKPE